MKLSFFTTCFGFFSVALCFAQHQSKEDSLKSVLQKAKGEKRMEILNQLFDETKLTDFNKALHYATQFNDLAMASGDSAKIVQGGRMRAFSLMDLGKNEEALKSILFVLGIAKRSQDNNPEMKKAIKSLLNNAGLCYTYVGNYGKALEFHYQSLLIREAEGDKRSIRNALNNIGLVFYNLEDYEHAVEYYSKVIKVSEELNDFSGMEMAFINLGLCYNVLHQEDKAAQTIKRALAICQSNCDNIKKEAYEALAYTFQAKHQCQQAKVNFLASLDIARKQKDSRFECENLFGLCEIEFELKNDDKGLEYLVESEEFAKQAKQARAKLSIYKKFSRFYQDHKDYEKSLLYLRKYLSLKDSIYNQQYIKDLPKVEANYEQRVNLRKIEEDAKILELQREIIDRQKKQVYLVSTIAALVGVLLFASFYFSRKLKAQNEAIHQKNEDLIKLNHEKNNLIGVVAHDLRGPLNLIKWLSALIKTKSKGDEESTEYLEMMEQSTGRLDEMVSKILDVEAIEAMGTNVKMEKVNFSATVQKVIDRYASAAARKAITINPQIAAGATVLADAGYVEQVLENLISNAIKFSPSEKNIYVVVTEEKENVICEIRDEGPGLSEEDKKYMFGKYQKLSAKPTGNETSLGLGLSIVKKFVEAMNGKVWCESEANKGASFFLKFALTE